MGKRFSAWILAVGILLVVIAIVWWAAIAPMLTQLPNEVQTDMEFEGTVTYYVNPQTGEFLPAGQEIEVPLTALRSFDSVDYLYTSDTAVFLDTINATIAGEKQPAQETSYALDRKTRKSVESPHGWVYSDQLVQEGRVGYLGALFPGGLSVGDTVEAFFNDPALPFDLEVVEEIADYNGLGITALKVDAAREEKPYDSAIANAVLIQGRGLPTEMTFADFSAALSAKGVDITALLGILQGVVSAEEMQAISAMTQQPIPLVYNQLSGDVVYIEKVTGATVGATFDRTTTVKPDLAMFADLTPLLGKYKDDPAIAQVGDTLLQLMSAGGTPVFNQTMTIIPKSEALLADSADDKVGLIKLVMLWIPLAVVLLGGVMVLLGGAVLVAKKGK